MNKNTNSVNKTYGYSLNGENYIGYFPTRSAALDASQSSGLVYQKTWTCEFEDPPQPETMWAADNWIEHVSIQDEYSGDHAEDWDHSTVDQKELLELAVKKVISDWLDEHDLRPKFHIAVKVQLHANERTLSIEAINNNGNVGQT